MLPGAQEYHMSEQIPTQAPTPAPVEANPVDLLQQGQSDLLHLENIRELVFSDEARHEQLHSWAKQEPETSLQAGMAWWILGDHDRALKAFEAHPDATGVKALRGLSLAGKSRAKEALELLTHPATPDEGKAKAVALATLVGQGGIDKSEIQALLDNPGSLAGSPILDFLTGLLHERSLEIDLAVDAYLRCHDRDPNFRENLFRLARLLELKGSDEEALELYENYCKLGPANVAVLMNLGILYEDMGEWRNAELCFNEAVKLDPNNQRALLYLEDTMASMVMHYDEDQERREDKRNAILRMPVTDFELSVRSRNCLAKMGIQTLGDLVRKTEVELLSYKNFGETSLFEIQEILTSKNLRLGMDPNELLPENFGKVAPSEDNYDVDDPRARPITNLELSVRSRRVIEQFKLRTIGDICLKTEAELMACPNFGQTSLNEIKSKLDDLGLSLKS